MANIFTYYQISTNMHGNSGNKEDMIESTVDKQENIVQSGNRLENQEITESRAKQMSQIWGDNFVSDSLH